MPKYPLQSTIIIMVLQVHMMQQYSLMPSALESWSSSSTLMDKYNIWSRTMQSTTQHPFADQYSPSPLLLAPERKNPFDSYIVDRFGSTLADITTVGTSRKLPHFLPWHFYIKKSRMGRKSCVLKNALPFFYIFWLFCSFPRIMTFFQHKITSRVKNDEPLFRIRGVLYANPDYSFRQIV